MEKSDALMVMFMDCVKRDKHPSGGTLSAIYSSTTTNIWEGRIQRYILERETEFGVSYWEQFDTVLEIINDLNAYCCDLASSDYDEDSDEECQAQ